MVIYNEGTYVNLCIEVENNKQAKCEAGRVDYADKNNRVPCGRQS